MKNIFIFVLILVFFQTSYAVVADMNLGLIQGGLSRATDQNIGRSINSLGIFANLGKTDASTGYLLGWYMSSVKSTDSFAGVIEQTLNSGDMGPAFRWQTTARQTFSFTYAYGIISKGNFSDGSVTEEINGESHLLKFAIESNVSDRFLVGLALNLYTANYKTSLVNSVQSSVGYKNNWTYPSLSVSFRNF